MLKVNLDDPYDRDVAVRILDFFRSEAPWQRRLWTVGTVLSLREVLEGSAAVQSGVLGAPSFATLCHHAELVAGLDPGAGGKEQRRLLQSCLRSSPRAEGFDWLTVQQLLDETQLHYLARWSEILSDKKTRPSAERTARSIASHLLDAGYSESFLHKWWTFRVRYQSGETTLADVVSEAHRLAQAGPTAFEILIPLTKVPGASSQMPHNWKTATEVSAWLRLNSYQSREVRQVGGFLLSLSARDEYAAVERSAEVFERLSARVHLATRSRLQLLGRAWVRGQPMPFPLRPSGHAVEVGALAREGKLYSDSGIQGIDAALELLGPLREGPPGPAVAGGWAAIEALLVGPGDGGKRSIAGDRLASLVACSFPRAELTTLAYAHSANSTDALARAIRESATNRERAATVQQAISAGTPLTLSSDSDLLARDRVSKLLAAPRKVLDDIEGYVGVSIQRIYRQRNLVLHWGRTDAVCLRAALRTAAPLIGAGIDRIAHAWFKHGTSPLELCARAAVRRSWLENPIGLVDLLEPR